MDNRPGAAEGRGEVRIVFVLCTGKVTSNTQDTGSHTLMCTDIYAYMVV